MTAGLIILNMSLTGVLLTYEKQIIAWADVHGGQPHLRGQLTLDRRTGEVVRWEPFTNDGAGRRLRSWFRFAHTGEVYGLVGQTVAGLVSLGGAFLVFTGLSLAWGRFYAWRGRRSRAADAPAVAEGAEAAGD